MTFREGGRGLPKPSECSHMRGGGLAKSSYNFYSGWKSFIYSFSFSIYGIYGGWLKTSYGQWRNWRGGGGGGGGKRPPRRPRGGPLFKKRPLLNRLLFFLNKFKNLKSSVYTNLFLLLQQCLAKLCARAFLNGTCIQGRRQKIFQGGNGKKTKK